MKRATVLLSLGLSLVLPLPLYAQQADDYAGMLGYLNNTRLDGRALSGADVIHTARRRFPALPVLLISGQDLRPAQNPALPEVEWLRKPFTRAQLAQALSAAYARI